MDNGLWTRQGFTLIEMLIVLAMFSLIGLAVVATLSNGIKIWQRLNQVNKQEDINIFFEKFTSELRNTFRFNTIKFQGQKEKISFATFVTTPGSRQAQLTGIGEVTYSYDKKKKQLSKQVRNYSQIYKDEAGKNGVLFENVESVRFDYYFYNSEEKEYIWLEDWQIEEALPLAVRIELEFENGRQSEKITRTIDIPISQSQS